MDYLIPANTKRGRLIFGFFTKKDLLIFGGGIFATFILLTIITVQSALSMILVLTPAMVCGILVIPVPYYHNIMTVLIELYEFVTNRQTYRWKGWCFNLVNKKKNK